MMPAVVYGVVVLIGLPPYFKLTMPIVYLNGEFIAREKATVSVMDRGFLFADAVYEVIPVYQGRYFLADEHLQRLDNSLQALQINIHLNHDDWYQIFERLLAQYAAGDYSIYLQVSRGAGAERDHAYPEPAPKPTIFVQATPLKTWPFERLAKGLSAITADDIRWSRCYIKSTSLLPNIMQREFAKQQSADEAILIRDGYVSEGTSSNVFLVKDNTIITHPEDGAILGGITRELIVKLAIKHGIAIKQRAILREELYRADEVWISSSTKEVAPIVRVDQHAISDGKAGPLWQKLWQYIQDFKQSL